MDCGEVPGQRPAIVVLACRLYLVDQIGWILGYVQLQVDDHLAADGQVQDIDEPFDVGGEQLMYPGDPAGSPGNTINCRCTVLPVME
jgi:uncharacterized protein with gpF-like domain